MAINFWKFVNLPLSPNLRDKIGNTEDLKNFAKEIEDIEKKITLFQAKASTEIIKELEIINLIDDPIIYTCSCFNKNGKNCKSKATYFNKIN